MGNEAECAASGWFAEQALDVESSHAMAPGANILFVGAQDCLDNSLLAALNDRGHQRRVGGQRLLGRRRR